VNIIQPDIDFIKKLTKDSKAPLKQCMQCGTCSVICELSPAEKPFPRKEMIWAGWGLKDKLLSDPDIWLCLQCGDCTTTCPRGVKPGDVLASIRNLSYLHYARPKFLAKLLSKPKYLPVVIAIPVIFILTIIYFAGTLTIPKILSTHVSEYFIFNFIISYDNWNDKKHKSFPERPEKKHCF
jgi:quinone-modifying oxidoreductase subunit QmoC